MRNDSQHEHIDITFDVRSDTRPGSDPDQHSATLRRYHQLLWSRPLPDGVRFELDSSTNRAYLHHQSERGEFWLASDAISHSYRSSYTRRIGGIISGVSTTLVDEMYSRGCTIGAHILFPSGAQAGQPTINQARGRHPLICDRFDLTLECIRRQYANEDNPLASCLTRFADFLELFGSFEGYVRFWMLDDLTVDDYAGVKPYLPVEDFERSALPASVAEYETYATGVLEFIAARNRRIAAMNLRT